MKKKREMNCGSGTNEEQQEIQRTDQRDKLKTANKRRHSKDKTWRFASVAPKTILRIVKVMLSKEQEQMGREERVERRK